MMINFYEWFITPGRWPGTATNQALPTPQTLMVYMNLADMRSFTWLEKVPVEWRVSYYSFNEHSFITDSAQHSATSMNARNNLHSFSKDASMAETFKG